MIVRVVLTAAAASLLSSLSPSMTATAYAQSRLSFVMDRDPLKAAGEIAVDGVRTVYVSGPIADGDTERFLQFVREKGLEAAKLEFDSPGGSLLEGVKLGEAIRKLRFFTAIGAIDDTYDKSHAICASACAYAFAGGVSRFLSTDGGRLGIHQFSSEKGISEADAQFVSGILVSYLREMGVDPEAFAVASATNPNGVTWLTLKEAEELGFANNGVTPTTAEIRVVQMMPYLRLNQDQYNVTIRVLFLCHDKSLSMEAGIVSDPEQSKDMTDPSWQKRSYIEVDGKEHLVVDGPSGAKPKDSTAWLMRPMSRQEANDLENANSLGVWIDGFGAIRLGGVMDLTSVHRAMDNYFTQCLN